MMCLTISCLHCIHHSPRIQNLQFAQVLRGQTHQEINLTIQNMPFYEARQSNHFMKHAKHAIICRTPSM